MSCAGIGWPTALRPYTCRRSTTCSTSAASLSGSWRIDFPSDFSRSCTSTSGIRARGESRRLRDAVVLLSGGLDSYTAAAIAKADGCRLFALTVRYGQRHAREIEAARAVAKA